MAISMRRQTTLMLDERLKSEATSMLDSIGLSLNAYLTLSLRQLVNQRRVPFELVAAPEEPNEEARRAMLVAEAKEAGLVEDDDPPLRQRRRLHRLARGGMMYAIKLDPAFKADYRRVVRRHPQIKVSCGRQCASPARAARFPRPAAPHVLDNPGGNYNGHIDFHLSDGAVDVVVLYLPHKTNPEIRFVRMGTHNELVCGPEK